MVLVTSSDEVPLSSHFISFVVTNDYARYLSPRGMVLTKKPIAARWAEDPGKDPVGEMVKRNTAKVVSGKLRTIDGTTPALVVLSEIGNW